MPADTDNRAPNEDRVNDATAEQGEDETALWAEFDRADAGGEPGEAAETPSEESGRAEEEDSAASESQAGVEGAGQQGSEASAYPEADADDIWANATAEQRAAYEAAQRSVSGLREQLDRRFREISRLKSQHLYAQPPQQPTQAASGEAAARGQPGQGEGEGETGDFLASPKWKEFAEEYPEVAGPLTDVIGELRDQIKRQERELSAIGTERRDDALAEQATLLAEEHSDWEQVVADRGFMDWLNAQPRHIQEAAVRNAENIVDAAEAADVVGRFKAFQQQHSTNTSRSGNARDNGNNQALAGKRARQLESASAARSRGPGAASGIPEEGDPETIWRQFDEMERREQARR